MRTIRNMFIAICIIIVGIALTTPNPIFWTIVLFGGAVSVFVSILPILIVGFLLVWLFKAFTI